MLIVQRNKRFAWLQLRKTFITHVNRNYCVRHNCAIIGQIVNKLIPYNL
jgi:hypothetical protein